MGQQADARLAEFRKRNGIVLPSAAEVEWIQRVRTFCQETPVFLILEESGIRDGDGFWHGTSAIAQVIGELERLAALGGTVTRFPGGRSPDSDYPQGRDDFDYENCDPPLIVRTHLAQVWPECNDLRGGQ